MQTIRINTRTNEANGITIFSINGVCIAHVGTDLYNVGRYAGRVNHAGGAVCNNKTFPEAVEFIGDAICSHFEKFGLEVEFVAA